MYPPPFGTYFSSWLFLGTLLVAGPLQAAEFPFFAQPNRENVRVRADSTVQSPILAELQRDAVIHVIDRKWGWYQIDLPRETHGYIHKDFLERIAEGEYIISGNRVNVRSYASNRAHVLGQINRDAKVTVLERDGEWVSIRPLPKLKGYVHSRLLTPMQKENKHADTAGNL